MKKQLFDGKLKDPVGFVVGLSILSGSCLFLSVLLTFVIVFGNNTATDKILMGVVVGAVLVIGIGHPILFVHVVKNREKHPRWAKLLVKPGYWVEGHKRDGRLKSNEKNEKVGKGPRHRPWK